MNQNNNTNLPVDPATSQAIQEIERGALTFQAVMSIAIKNTMPEDWVSYGDKAWLSGPASERIARAIGLAVKDWHWQKENYEDDKGKYYIITVEGFVGHKPSDQWVPAIGVQWSRKPFFFKDGNRERHLSEINPGHIIKDAYTDMFRNGVTRFLGLRGLPWSRLGEFGITKGKARKVEFNTKKTPAGSGAKKNSQAPQKYATDEQRAFLCRNAIKKVIETTEDKILETLPEKLSIDALNELLKFIMEIETGVEIEAWTEKVKEVA